MKSKLLKHNISGDFVIESTDGDLVDEAEIWQAYAVEENINLFRLDFPAISRVSVNTSNNNINNNSNNNNSFNFGGMSPNSMNMNGNDNSSNYLEINVSQQQQQQPPLLSSQNNSDMARNQNKSMSTSISEINDDVSDAASVPASMISEMQESNFPNANLPRIGNNLNSNSNNNYQSNERNLSEREIILALEVEKQTELFCIHFVFCSE